MKIEQRFVILGVGCLLLGVCIWLVIFNAPVTHHAADQSPLASSGEKALQVENSSGKSPSFSSMHPKTKSRPASVSSAAAAQVITAAPPGPSVGFLLSEIDSSLLSAEEDAILFEVQNKFATMMAEFPVKDPTNPEYHRQWKQAVQYCDSLLRLRLGQDGFNRMNFLASQETERLKKP